MNNIRPATTADLVRIAEIEIFNYRLNFYPIFKDDLFYFSYLTVPALIEKYNKCIDKFYVYDDGAVKGFVKIKNREIKKLFVEPVLQNSSIGGRLLQFALEKGTDNLWTLEKNAGAIRFYKRYGFHPTDSKKLEEGTTEYLVHLKLLK